MRKTLLFGAIAYTLIACSDNKTNQSVSQQQTSSYEQRIDSLFEIYENNGEFMGNLAISVDGKIAYTKNIGYADIESKKKSNINTRYRIGSVSKMYTAALIFKAIDEKKLSLDETIEGYFPKVKNSEIITIGQLLQHRSGIFSFTKDKSFFEYRTEPKSSQKMLELIANFDSEFEPDSKGDYSNSNYFLLSQILEKTYNQSYESILKEKILDPFKLKNTFNGSTTNIDNNECFSYSFDSIWTKFPETHLSIGIGSGSVVASAGDLTTFIDNLFSGNIISAESLLNMQTITDTYGMGLMRYTIADRKGYGHRGRIDEHRSTAIHFPDEKLSLVITSNGSKKDLNVIYQDVLKLYLGDAQMKAPQELVQKFAGIYKAQSDNAEFTFTEGQGTLIHVMPDGFEEKLVYKGNNRFVLEQMYAESMSFTFAADGSEMTLSQGEHSETMIRK